MKHSSCSLLLLALFAVTGCGDKTSDNGGSGGGADSKKFVGKWELDTAAMADVMKGGAGAEALPPGMDIEALLSGMKVDVELKADGSATFAMSFIGDTENATGKWTASGDTVTIETTSDKGEKETVQGTLSGDKLKFTREGEDMQLHLKRAS